jgi:hypothetical protein
MNATVPFKVIHMQTQYLVAIVDSLQMVCFDDSIVEYLRLSLIRQEASI